MILITVDHPAGALGPHDRDLVADSILDLFLATEGHAEETVERARTSTHIAFRGLDGWRTGSGAPAEECAPPLIIRVSVPEGWHEASATFIGLIRTAVRRWDDERGLRRDRGSLWVLVDGVPDGHIGLDGRPATADDVLDYLTEDFRTAQAAGQQTTAPPGRLLDPICGMIVADGPRALAVHDGEARLGFCSQGCRDAYLREHPTASPVR